MPKAISRKIQCTRCRYKWKVRGELPKEVKFCPSCHSPYWNLPKGFLKRGRPKNIFTESIKIYKDLFKFDLDFDSIKQHRLQSKLPFRYVGPKHNKEHMRIKAKIIRAIRSPKNKELRELGYTYKELKTHINLSKNTIKNYGKSWELSFYISPKYFNLFNLSEKKLCYSLQNLYAKPK